MNFLDNFVIPQPDYNLNLLNVFLVLGLTIFMVYSGILFGSIILSVYYKNKSKNFNDSYSRISLEYAGLITDKWIYGFGLGAVPFLSVIFIYMQLLHKSEVAVVNYLTLSFVLYIAGMVLAFNYNKAFHLAKVFDKVSLSNSDADEKTNSDFEAINNNAKSKLNSLGNFSIILQIVAYWYLMAALSLAVHPNEWANSNFISILISNDSLLQIFQFLTVSIALTGITYLFRTYVWDKKDIAQDEYFNFGFKTNIWISLISVLMIPVFFAAGIWSLPLSTVNTLVFFTTLAGVVLVLLILQLLYAAYKNTKLKYLNYTFFAALLLVLAVSLKDKTAFAIANREQVLVLNEEYLAHKQEFMASLGMGKVVIDGGEIYNGRCTACHKAEDAATAPAHKNIIQKYLTQSDPKAALAKFVLNPVKVNPNYPPMPNQGLNPAEAQAVAEFMIKKYSGKADSEKKPQTMTK